MCKPIGLAYPVQMLMIAVGVGTAVGYNYGAGNRDRIREAGKITYIAAAAIALIGTCLFFIFGREILCLFSASDEMLGMGIPALKIISVTFVPAAVTMISGYFASGMGNGVTNMVSSFLGQFVPLIPCAYLIARFMGIDGVWYAFWISETVADIYAVISVLHIWKKSKEETS